MGTDKRLDRLLGSFWRRLSLPLGLTPEEARRALALPLSLLLLFLLGFPLYTLLDLPEPNELIRLLEDSFVTHGYKLVFLAALLEGLLFFGWHLPGTVALLIGGILGAEGTLNPLFVFSSVISGLFVAICADYALGRFGWYHLLVRFGLKNALGRMKSDVERRKLSVIRYTYFHPNLAALAATSCGILKIGFAPFAFHSAVALLGWNLLWGSIIYVLGRNVRSLLNWPAVLIAVGLVIVLRLVIARRRHGARKDSSHEHTNQ